VSYAIRKDSQGWRAVNSIDDVLPDEDYSEDQPAPVAPNPDYAAEIDALERQNLMPRATREFMLLMYSTTAAGQGIPPSQLLDPNDTHYSPAFAKLESLDLQIKALRAKL